ncbi:MAG: hypothetical protein ABH837_02370 [bacterium]
MSNIIEEARNNAARRDEEARNNAARNEASLIESQKKLEAYRVEQKEIHEYNRRFSLESKEAFEDTGILLVFAETHKKITGDYSTYYPYWIHAYDHEDRIPSISVGLESDISEHDITEKAKFLDRFKPPKYVPTMIERLSRNIDINYHPNGNLEFVSAGDNPHLKNSTSSRFLTKDQWLSDQNLLASTLEHTINHPYLKSSVFEKISQPAANEGAPG